MSDPTHVTSDPETPTPPAALTAANEVLHRLTARLAALDLDPPTVELLTAVLDADLVVAADPVDRSARR